MRELPINEHPSMIRALLDGRRTMMRWILKPQPDISYVYGWGIGREGHPEEWTFLNGPTANAAEWDPWKSKHCPRFRPGDRLWVRETWKPFSIYAERAPRDIPPSKVFYRADDSYAQSNTRWFPSIHMPRWASRLTLIVG